MPDNPEEWQPGYGRKDRTPSEYEPPVYATPGNLIRRDPAMKTIGGRQLLRGDPLSRRRRRHRLAIAGLVASAALLVGTVGYRDYVAPRLERAREEAAAKRMATALPESKPDPSALTAYEEAVKLVQAGKAEQSLALFKQLAEEQKIPDGKEERFYHHFGDVAVLLGEESLALECYTEAIERSKGTPHPDLLNSAAFLEMKNGGDLVTAEKLVRQAIAQDPDNANYIDTLACVFLKSGDLEKAVSILEGLVPRASGQFGATVREHLGDAYWLQGDATKAAEEWREAAVLDPENEEIWERILKVSP